MMMESTINVADQVLALMRRNEAITKLAEKLKEIGSVEQAERETTARLEAARAECERVEGKLSALASRECEIKSATAATESRAAENARRIISAATVRADALIESAADAAERKIAQATGKADEIIGKAEAAAREMYDRNRTLKDEISGLAREIAAKNAEIAQIDTKLAAAKDAAKRVMSG